MDIKPDVVFKSFIQLNTENFTVRAIEFEIYVREIYKLKSHGMRDCVNRRPNAEWNKRRADGLANFQNHARGYIH